MFRKYILILAAGLGLIACRGNGEGLEDRQVRVTLSRQYSNDLSQDQQPSEQINSLRYYICNDGLVSFVSPDLTDDVLQGQTFRIDKTYVSPTGRIYVLANGELAPGLDRVIVGAAEGLLSGLQTSQSQNNGQVLSMAMAAQESLSAYQDGGVIPLKLKRNIARFDLFIQQNVGIEVLSVRVSGLQTASSVFDNGNTTSDNTASYTSDFQVPQTKPIDRLFYAHSSQSGNSAVVEIDAKYNGILATLSTTINQIQRNTIQVLSVAASSGTLSLDVLVDNMEQGDSDSPDKEGITPRINPNNSQLPEGASVSNDGLRLHMPYWGAEATIVLDSPSGLVLKEVNGQVDNFTITPISPDGLSYKISTQANVRTNEQPKTVILAFSHPDDKQNNELRLAVVIDNYAPFPAVAIGSVDWMHSNSRGLYPPLHYQEFPAGADVRTIYAKPIVWQSFASRSFQWGPRPGKDGVQISLNPLGAESSYGQSGHTVLPTLNGAIIGTPTQWQGATVPCPKGWRLPTYSEFASIWPPNGTVIPLDTPISYTLNGKQYTAVIETFGGSYYSNITESGSENSSPQQARNLIISDGQAEILFPICGFRKPNGTFKYTVGGGGSSMYNQYGLGVGAEAFYWCADKSADKFVAVGISNKVIQNHQNNREHNAWYSVRCVRDKKK